MFIRRCIDVQRLSRALLSAMACVAATGCTTVPVRSEKFDPTKIDNGVVYCLPKKLLRISAHVDTNGICIASIEELPAVPDTNFCYIARFHHSIGREDEFRIVMTSSGLLSVLETTSEDKTADIAVALAQTAVQAARLVTAVAPLRITEPAVRTVVTVFDPTSIESVRVASNELGKLELQLDIVPEPPNPSPAAKALRNCDGIIHRLALPVTVTVRQNQDTLLSQPYLIPNAGPMLVVPLEAGPFVKTKHSLKFQDGQLTDASASRPSEVFGFVKLLPETIRYIVSIPGEILKVKVEHTQATAAQIEARKALLAARQPKNATAQPEKTTDEN